MDKVKEEGLDIIRRRQQCATDLRQRVDSCDRLEALEIDNLRSDIKKFVTDRRYDLCEELISSHRFEYDQSLIDNLKNFGTVLRIDRKYDRSRTLSTSSGFVEPNGTTTDDLQSSSSPIPPPQPPTTTAATTTTTLTTPITTNGRKSSNEAVSPINNINHQPLPQRTHNKQNINGNTAGDYYHNSHPPSQTNGFYQYYDDSYNHQSINKK